MALMVAPEVEGMAAQMAAQMEEEMEEMGTDSRGRRHDAVEHEQGHPSCS